MLRVKMDTAENLRILKDENARLQSQLVAPTASSRCIECWNRHWHSTPPQSPDLHQDGKWFDQLRTPCAPTAK